MKKTPITDKLHKYLRLVELANTLDVTGGQPQRFKDVNKKAGEDFDKALGLDTFKKAFGADDADKLDIRGYAPKGSKYGAEASATLLPYKLFENLRPVKIGIIEVSHSATPEAKVEAHKYPYIWSSRVFNSLVINEESIYSLSGITGSEDGTFWRSDTNNVYVRRTGTAFDGYYFTPSLAGKYENYLHQKQGSSPAPMSATGAYLSKYASANYKSFLAPAIEKLRSFVTDENNKFFLGQLSQTNNINDLPPIVKDSIMVGILDAVNTKVYKATDAVSTSATKAPQGAELLSPTDATMGILNTVISTAVRSADVADDSYMPKALITDLAANLTQVFSSPSPYDNTFIANLAHSLVLRKANVQKKIESANTMLFFILSQGANAIYKALGGIPKEDPLAVASGDVDTLLYGKIGYGNPGERSAELRKAIPKPDNINQAPLVVIRSITSIAGVPIRIEPYTQDLGTTEKKKQSSFMTSGANKDCSLSNEAHNIIKSRSLKVGPGVTEEQALRSYISNAFVTDPNMSAIQGADLGGNRWKRILQTCYDPATTDFRSGVLFVGISQLYWDKNMQGGDIYTCDRNVINQFEIHCARMEAEPGTGGLFKRIELSKTFTAKTGLDLLCDRDWDENTGQLSDPVSLLPDPNKSTKENKENEAILKARMQAFKTKFEMKKLDTIGEQILKDLYNMPDQQDLSAIAQGEQRAVLENIKAGFWTTDVPYLNLSGELLVAGGNPWDYEEANSKDVSKRSQVRRFVPGNISNDSIKKLRDEALSGNK